MAVPIAKGHEATMTNEGAGVWCSTGMMEQEIPTMMEAIGGEDRQWQRPSTGKIGWTMVAGASMGLRVVGFGA